jgi:hypothetical protein
MPSAYEIVFKCVCDLQDEIINEKTKENCNWDLVKDMEGICLI